MGAMPRRLSQKAVEPPEGESRGGSAAAQPRLPRAHVAAARLRRVQQGHDVRWARRGWAQRHRHRWVGLKGPRQPDGPCRLSPGRAPPISSSISHLHQTATFCSNVVIVKCSSSLVHLAVARTVTPPLPRAGRGTCENRASKGAGNAVHGGSGAIRLCAGASQDAAGAHCVERRAPGPSEAR